jgi:hypothetical protein
MVELTRALIRERSCSTYTAFGREETPLPSVILFVSSASPIINTIREVSLFTVTALDQYLEYRLREREK